ncbi:hypothetical protein [Protofrankia symbiont of Coriaria ruscifolia]|uniref:Putative ATP synthase protein I n=1 Tax=Candidatus Protofrankia californiensis TaxID=1839754 RepID=A0A1C3PES1_9ACTN|nr:hypothetical protein [Protofrankia symbiont of Coriaria ruscifolia]SBW28337.1 putative ATP synthase protein I [Candidatus Protofrankia californiensis]
MITAAGRTIRVGLLVLAVIALPAFTVAGFSRGPAGLAAVALGLVLVASFFTVSKVAVSVVARRMRAMVLPTALGTYLIKIVILGALLVTLEGSSAIDLAAFAWAVLTGVLGWLGAELWVATHTRVPFYDPEVFRARDDSRRDTLNT